MSLIYNNYLGNQFFIKYGGEQVNLIDITNDYGVNR